MGGRNRRGNYWRVMMCRFGIYCLYVRNLRRFPEKYHAQIETDCRYAAYLGRQRADIEAMRRDEALAIPSALNYRQIGGLSAESVDILVRHRPEGDDCACESVAGVDTGGVIGVDSPYSACRLKCFT